ncbi:MAG TPA: hypothetical protein VK217_13300 [Acidimicrobiales bacterium]|nr:hypothetical protein [Acidimicrobiales bacterium]
MRFKTGFVVGCAAGFYLTQKARQLRAPLAGRTWVAAPTTDWPRRSGPGMLGADLKAEKVRALGDLARERASDLLRGPAGDLARERVIALFEGALAAQREEAAKRA